MVDMIVLPFLAKSLRSSMTCRAVVESSPVVGSSKKMALGLVISYIPMEVLFLYPPETPFMKVFPILTSAQSVRPNYYNNYSTRSDFLKFDISKRKSAANWKHYFGVKVPNKASSCIT